MFQILFTSSFSLLHDDALRSVSTPLLFALFCELQLFPLLLLTQSNLFLPLFSSFHRPSPLGVGYHTLRACNRRANLLFEYKTTSLYIFFMNANFHEKCQTAVQYFNSNNYPAVLDTIIDMILQFSNHNDEDALL